MILVVLAMGRILSLFFWYKMRPEPASINTAAPAYNFMSSPESAAAVFWIWPEPAPGAVLDTARVGNGGRKTDRMKTIAVKMEIIFFNCFIAAFKRGVLFLIYMFFQEFV